MVFDFYTVIRWTTVKMRIVLLASLGGIIGWGHLSHAQERFVSMGERYTLEGKGLSIVPPFGWEVIPNYQGMSLLMQAPEDKKLNYRRSIQVLSFKGSQYIDSMTAEAFKEIIQKKFSQASRAITHYEVTEFQPITLQAGQPAYLFYAKFRIGSFKLMQAHVLVSSATRHFLATYTDLERYFSQDYADSTHLDEAWQSLMSIQVDSLPGSRYERLMRIGLSSFLFFALLGTFIFWRKKRKEKIYQAYAKEAFVDEEIVVEESQVSAMTDILELTEDELLQSKVTTHHGQLEDDVDDDWNDVV